MAVDRATLNIDRAAVVAGVTRRTIYYWIASGHLEVKPIRSGQRVYVDSLLRNKKGQRYQMRSLGKD